jgi:hypothetical protein
MPMFGLSPEARALIERARVETRPPPGKRERIEALLAARLGTMGPIPGRSGGRSGSTSAGHSWRWFTSLTVGAVMVGGVSLWSLAPHGDQTSAVRSVNAPAPLVPTSSAPISEPEVDVPAPVSPLPARSVRPPTESKAGVQPAQEALAQEVALLTRASSDVRAGRAGTALRLLDEHQRRFPSGVLVVERRAVKAQALCSLKRVSEGRAELAQLDPRSPAAGRAKQLCDAASGVRP